MKSVLFSNLQPDISKFVNFGDSIFLPACCTCISNQNQVLLWYLDQIFVTYIIRNGKASQAKSPEGRLDQGF